jgi:hypothetical protein
MACGFNRTSRRDTSISGAVSPDDGWACKQPVIADNVHFEAFKLQCFTRIVVPEGTAVVSALQGVMAEAGTQLVAADGVGQQQPWRYVPSPEFSLVSMLPHVFDTAGGDDEGENGGGQEEAIDAEG